MITPSIFYLIDTQDMSVLFGHQNKHIVVSLGSGILGSQVCFTSDLVAVHTILNFVNHPGQMGIQGIAPLKGSSGLKHQVRSPGSFILSERPQIVEKINLIKTRRPAIEVLWNSYQTAMALNTHGFFNDISIIIEPNLNNPQRIAEYASVMGISKEFALQELSMISESTKIDNFRLFTMCNYWQMKINDCTTADEINSLIDLIQQSFWSVGFADV
jgi:hypothetical protein